jgi:glycosyltransferase involved in cell wall biosynthesis
MNPTRVVLAGFYPPPFAGESIHVKQLADLLRERGLQVVILNLNRHAAPNPEYLGASTPWGLMRLLVAAPDRASILHIHTNGHSWKSWLMIATAAMTARLKGVRTLLTIHSGLFPGYVSTLGRFRRAIARRVLKSFDRVIGVNGEIGHAMEHLGISGRELAVIPAFLGVSRSAELSAADRAVVDGRRPVVVAVGGGDRDPELGLPTVINTLPELIALFPDIRVVFVGWQVGSKTQPLIESRGLTGHAVCLGEVPHARCLSLLQRADVIVRSTFSDGDAITIREALALRVPVVASDTAFRPPGVILFRKGDAPDLLDKLKQVLTVPPARTEQADANGLPVDDLWQIYSGLVGEESIRPRGPLDRRCTEEAQ